VPLRPCVVSFTDPDGFRHSVEVQAESLYEAVVLATRAFKEHGCAPGLGSQLEVKIQSPVVTHTSLHKVREWLNGACKSPNEKVTKDRLKGLLAG
jgi:hypothetical protein